MALLKSAQDGLERSLTLLWATNALNEPTQAERQKVDLMPDLHFLLLQAEDNYEPNKNAFDDVV